jgi:hypothetical protein
MNKKIIVFSILILFFSCSVFAADLIEEDIANFEYTDTECKDEAGMYLCIAEYLDQNGEQVNVGAFETETNFELTLLFMFTVMNHERTEIDDKIIFVSEDKTVIWMSGLNLVVIESYSYDKASFDSLLAAYMEKFPPIEMKEWDTPDNYAEESGMYFFAYKELGDFRLKDTEISYIGSDPSNVTYTKDGEDYLVQFYYLEETYIAEEFMDDNYGDSKCIDVGGNNVYYKLEDGMLNIAWNHGYFVVIVKMPPTAPLSNDVLQAHLYKFMSTMECSSVDDISDTPIDDSDDENEEENFISNLNIPDGNYDGYELADLDVKEKEGYKASVARYKKEGSYDYVFHIVEFENKYQARYNLMSNCYSDLVNFDGHNLYAKGKLSNDENRMDFVSWVSNNI